MEVVGVVSLLLAVVCIPSCVRDRARCTTAVAACDVRTCAGALTGRVLMTNERHKQTSVSSSIRLSVANLLEHVQEPHVVDRVCRLT